MIKHLGRLFIPSTAWPGLFRCNRKLEVDFDLDRHARRLSELKYVTALAPLGTPLNVHC